MPTFQGSTSAARVPPPDVSPGVLARPVPHAYHDATMNERIAATAGGQGKILALVFTAVWFLVTAPVYGARKHAGTSAAPAASDAHLKEFLQKRFEVPDPSWIVLGAPVASPIPGLFSRSVTVSNGRGQTAKLMLFINEAGNKAVLGQYLDLKGSPWNRVSLKGIQLKDRPTLGPADAPVTMVEFADLECPYCARAFGEVEDLVRNTYKGRARLIFKNFPLQMHPWALQAAIAAECIRRQNPADFWQFAGVIYSTQSSINPSNLRERVDNFAHAAQLDPKALDQCMMGSSAEKQIKEDVADAQKLQVMSTPTFFINGVRVVGLPDDKVFRFVLDGQLKHVAGAHR